MGVVRSDSKCKTVGIQGIAWSFGGMIFALVYCTAGISGIFLFLFSLNNNYFFSLYKYL
jgi:hypothetical protein